MSLIAYAGFDHDDPQTTYWSGAFSLVGRITSPAPRTGTHAADLGVGSMGKLVSNLATVIAGGAFYGTSTTLGAGILRFIDGSTEHLTVTIETNRSIAVRRGGASGTILGQTAVDLFPPNAWNYIELKATIHDTTGSYELRFNGVQKLTGTNIDTKNTTNAYVTEVRFSTAYLDDCYIADTSGSANNDFLGDVRCETLYPTGAGTYTDFTPSTGSNWQNVDDTPTIDNDSTYNSSATAGHKDTFATSNLSAATGVVKGVMLKIKARKDDAGTRELATYSKSGATETAGASEALGLSYVNYTGAIQETNPDTSAAWTVAQVNAVEIGYKNTT